MELHHAGGDEVEPCVVNDRIQDGDEHDGKYRDEELPCSLA